MTGLQIYKKDIYQYQYKTILELYRWIDVTNFNFMIVNIRVYNNIGGRNNDTQRKNQTLCKIKSS